VSRGDDHPGEPPAVGGVRRHPATRDEHHLRVVEERVGEPVDAPPGRRPVRRPHDDLCRRRESRAHAAPEQVIAACRLWACGDRRERPGRDAERSRGRGCGSQYQHPGGEKEQRPTHDPVCEPRPEAAGLGRREQTGEADRADPALAQDGQHHRLQRCSGRK
jgi:hypothetical protein